MLRALTETRPRGPMGAAENVAILQCAYDAFNTGDLDTLNEIFDGNAGVASPRGKKQVTPTTIRALDAILEYFGQLAQETDGHVPGRAAAPDSR